VKILTYKQKALSAKWYVLVPFQCICGNIVLFHLGGNSYHFFHSNGKRSWFYDTQLKPTLTSCYQFFTLQIITQWILTPVNRGNRMRQEKVITVVPVCVVLPSWGVLIPVTWFPSLISTTNARSTQKPPYRTEWKDWKCCALDRECEKARLGM